MSSQGKSRRIQDTSQAAAKSGRSKTPAKAAAARRRHGGLFALDAEQSARALLFGVTATVLIAAAAFIGIGYYVTVVQPRHRTVMEVDGIKVSYSDMKRRMAYEYYSNPGLQSQQSLFAIPQIAYQNLLDELTLIARAESELGVTVTDEEFQARLRSRVGVGEDAPDQAFSDSYKRALSESRLHRDEFERQVRADVLGDKVGDKLFETKPAAIPQAKIEVIAVEDQATAQQAIDRINAGELFADVAKALSLESEAQTSGGVKDFNFDKAIPAAYRDFAFTAAIGELSGPLIDPSGQGANYVVRVIERQDQPLRTEQEPLYKSEIYRQWLTDTQAKMVIIDRWSADQEAQASAAEPLFQDLIDKQRQAQEQASQPTVPIPTVQITSVISPAAEGTTAAETPAASTPANGP